MATIEEKIEAALLSRVASLSLTPARQIAYPNTPFTPAVGTAYIQVLHFPNRATRLFLKGSDPHFRQGILQLTVVAPLHGGPQAATKIAGEIAEHFPADLALYSEGLKVRIQQAPDVMPADKTDVSWDVVVGVRYDASA